MNKDYLLPKEIVAHLDKYIIGQKQAKKSVAIALRNRWRRQNASEEMRREIMPNNIILIGPTGVGKTEIARRLAALAGAPFVKVEASKFTEVGYVGRDVDSMVRDLVDTAVNMIKNEKAKEFNTKAEENSIDRILDKLIPQPKKIDEGDDITSQNSMIRTREIFRKKLLEGKLEDKEIEVDTPQSQFPVVEIFSPMGMEELGVNFQEMFSGMVPKKTKLRKMYIKEARRFIFNEEISKLINMDDVIPEALERVQESGIIFIDEIDKIVGDSSKTGPDVSREGVQRDILPIIEGCGVSTKYGLIRTDHILFIAAGAFHVASPSDLIPELQGRFPIRVELDSLTADDFERILTEPKTSLVKQYQALLGTENVELIFSDESIKKIAEYAERVNMESENIGARRLHTVLTTLLEEILYSPPVRKKSITITADMVKKSLDKIIENEDLSKYIL